MDALLESFLHRLPVLAGLDDEAIAFLGGLVRSEDYVAEAVIVREGEPGDRVFFVRHGRVRVCKHSPGEPPVQLAELGPGEYFGEMSLVESVARSATVTASAPTQVYTLKSLDFYKLYRCRPDQYSIVILNIARDLCRRLRQLDEKFALISH